MYTNSEPRCTPNTNTSWINYTSKWGRNDKLRLVKNPWFPKYPTKRMKRLVTDWEMFANHILGKGLVLRIQKELSETNSLKTTEVENKLKT